MIARVKRRMGLALSAAVIVAACSGTEPETDDGDLIVNGSFELPGPTSWVATVVQGTLPYHTFAVDSTQAHSGRRSAMIRLGVDHPPTVIFYNWFQPIVAGYEVGRSYQVEAWGKTTNVSQAQYVYLDVRFFDANNAQVGREWQMVPGSAPSVGVQSDWRQLAFPFIVPAGIVAINVRAGITAPFNAGATVWFDDIRIVPLAGP